MDISVFKAVCRELAEELPGARIVEASEGEAGEFCLVFKTPGGKHHLLMSPRPDLPRIYLTESRACRAKSLSPSAQAIANRILGSTVTSVMQDGLERAVSFGLTRKTRKDTEEYVLIYETAGKKPNIIVTDGAGVIVTAQTYVPLSDDAARPLLPGMSYEQPPLPDKTAPDKLTEEKLAGLLEDNPGMPLDKLLFSNVGGISPLIAREADALAGGARDAGRLVSALDMLIARMDAPCSPRIIHTPGGPVLAAFGLAQYAGCREEEYVTMSETAERYYDLLSEMRHFENTKAALLKAARKRLASADRKLAALRADMEKAGGADTCTHYGNLLMASLSTVPERAEAVELPDLFKDDGSTVTIPLDPKLSPVKNAERYFTMARKAASGMVVIKKRLADAEKYADRLKREVKEIEGAENHVELESLADADMRPGRSVRGPAGRGDRPDFPGFTSSDGFEVVFGKSAKVNDILTFKYAEPMDLWLHAQGYHGAHVIVRNPQRRPDIPLQTILEAAEVAAYHSNARKDSSVAVDYTFRKYVRKPRDPVPGQAIFTRNKTVFVKPVRRG